MAHTQTHSRFWLCVLDETAHARTCGYWYTVTCDGALPHTAFATRAGLMRWLDERGLTVAAEIPAPGKVENFPIVGSYRKARSMCRADFEALEGGHTRELSNGEYTLAIITRDADGLRTVHTLNPNIRDRPVFDYRESRALDY